MSKPKTSKPRQPAAYSPQGCNQPVMTHLTTGERISLNSLATKEQRSMSATVRMLIIEGLERRANQPE